MSWRHACFYFDFIDPLSYLFDIEIGASERHLAVRVERVGFELRPPPTPLSDCSDAFWVDRWNESRRLGLEIPFDPARLVPWTRKAHELLVLANEHGLGSALRTALFEAYFLQERDIGRVDQLVELGSSVGLDRSKTKAALDVDRYEQAVVVARREAADLGVSTVPQIEIRGRLVEGFHNPADLSTLLGGP